MKSGELPALPETVITALPGWQKKYGKLRFIELADGEEEEPNTLLVFRSSTRGEATALLKSMEHNQTEAESNFVENLLIYPEEYDFDSLAEMDFNQILAAVWSEDPFGNPEKFFDALEQKRNELRTSIDKLIETFICAAYDVKPKYVNNLTSDQILEHLASAELILGRDLPVELKGRVSANHPDPEIARAQLKQSRIARKMEARQRRWDSEARIPDMPAEPDVKTHSGGPVNTRVENEALFRVRPDLRRK